MLSSPVNTKLPIQMLLILSPQAFLRVLQQTHCVDAHVY